MVTGLPADAVSVAVADLATCAALADGSVYCWGENAYGELGDLNTTLGMQNQPVLATSTMKFTALAASQHAFCGRRDDGTGASEIDCWGQSVIGGFGDGFWAEQTVTTKQLAKVATGASDLSLGWSSDIDGNNIDEYDLELGCGVFAGDVKCWGDDSYGQLGNGGATLAATPTPVGGPAFATIAIGNEHACGVDMASKLYCWGSTTSGQATGVAAAGTKQKCDGIIDCDVGVPKQITATMTVDQVVAGYDFTCQLLGSVVSCWGDDSVQQLGTSNAGPRPKMVTNPGGMAWTRLIPTGGQLTCGTVGAAGQGYCWGSNPFTGGNSGPVAVNDVTGALQVLLGGLNTVSVVDASHELECQGDNTQGEFGDGTTTNATMLQPLGRFYAKVARSVWSAHACGIAMSDQHVECWGPNGRGQVGDTTGTDPVLSPFTLPQLAACTDVAVSAADSCALCGNTVYCWGDNTRGQLGNGTITTDKQPTPTPVALPGGETWMDLGAGSTFTCVRAASGHVFCWGRGSHGGLGNGGIPANLPSLVRASPM
jgi:alpha-tubulin suppressor-like RCC1 family protein